MSGASHHPVVVVGAGPASLIFALKYLELAPKNATVEIFERRPKPTRMVLEENSIESNCTSESTNNDDRAFGFGMGKRAQHYLQQIPGLYVAIEKISQKLGDGPGSSWIVNRQDLCAECIHFLEHKHGATFGDGRLKIHFNCDVKDMSETSPESSECNISGYIHVQDGGDLSNPQNSIRAVPYSVLVAADGASSPIRSSLVRQKYIKGRRYSSGSTWKALQLPRQPNIPTASQSYSYKTEHDVGRLLPRFPGRFVLLNFRSARAKHPNPFGASAPQELKLAIECAIPNVTRFPPDSVLQDFLDQPAGDTSYMTLNRIYVPECKTVLLGDAAVGMYSLLGQGCAYAMQCALRLAESLSSSGRTADEEFDKMLEAVSVLNQEEGKALADLNLISHIRSKPIVKKVAAKVMPAIMQGLGDPDQPYSEIAREARRGIRISKPFWWLERTKSKM